MDSGDALQSTCPLLLDVAFLLPLLFAFDSGLLRQHRLVSFCLSLGLGLWFLRFECLVQDHILLLLRLCFDLLSWMEALVISVIVVVTVVLQLSLISFVILLSQHINVVFLVVLTVYLVLVTTFQSIITITK